MAATAEHGQDDEHDSDQAAGNTSLPIDASPEVEQAPAPPTTAGAIGRDKREIGADRPRTQEGAHAGPKKTKVVVRDAAWSTWWAVLFYVSLPDHVHRPFALSAHLTHSALHRQYLLCPPHLNVHPPRASLAPWSPFRPFSPKLNLLLAHASQSALPYPLRMDTGMDGRAFDRALAFIYLWRPTRPQTCICQSRL